MNIVHIINVLTFGFHHIHCAHHLFQYYLHHRAIQLLRSGATSETPANYRQARQLLWYLVTHGRAPVDW